MDGIELIVRSHFDGYVPGDIIADKAKIEAILEGPNQHDVVKRKIAPPPITPPTAVKP